MRVQRARFGTILAWGALVLAAVLDVRAAGGQVFVDFESFADGTFLTSQLADQGILFPEGAIVIDCAVPANQTVCPDAHSGTKVILPPGQELTRRPLVVQFTSPQRWADLFVRADANTPTQRATLGAFDDVGAPVWYHDTSDISGWGLGMAVQGGFPPEPVIHRIELTSSWFNFFHVDDLRISGDTPPPPDTTPPTLVILEPGDGALVSPGLEERGRVGVRIRALDPTLATVAGWVEHDATGTRYGVDFCGTGSSPVCPLASLLDTTRIFTAENEGAYTLFLEACDGARNCTDRTRSFTVELPEPPPPVEADLWVLGIEYNQGYQDHVYTDLGSTTGIGWVPISCGSDRCPDSRFAAPIVPGRPMAVRAYVGVLGAGPADVPVRGRLEFWNCVTGITEFRTLVPVENPACADHLGNPMPCRREILAQPSLGRLGLRTNTDYDVDLVAMRTDLGRTLNFVVPAHEMERIGESGCMSLDVEVEFPAGERFVDPIPANNEFQFTMENVEDPNPLVIRRVRIATPGRPAVTAAAADDALDDMLRMTVPYDEVVTESDVATFWDGVPLTLDLGRLGTFTPVDQCTTLWLFLWQQYGFDARRTLLGLTPPGINLNSCGGFGWRVPRPIPLVRRREDYLGGVAFSETNLPGTLAQEVYHADRDLRHVSNLHNENSGCTLTGTGADILGSFFNLDPDCFHDAVHPHGEIGTYPAAQVRLGAPPGPGTFDSATVYGNVGNVGIEMEPDGSDWKLTLYDPCPTGPFDPNDPAATFGQRWDGSPGYNCALPDIQRPHDFMSYGLNAWMGVQLNPFLKSSQERGRAVFTGDAWVGDASELFLTAAAPDHGAHSHDHDGHSHARHAGLTAPEPAPPLLRQPARRRLKTLPTDGLQFAGIVRGNDVGLAPLSIPVGATTPLLPRRSKPKLPLEMIVEDAAGVVGRVPVAAMVTPPHPESAIFFTGGLPEGLRPEALRLRLDGVEIASHRASPSPPVLELLEPDGGEVWPRFTTRSVKWNVSDADGDDVTVSVRFSADAGETWHPLGSVNGSAGSLDIGTGELPVTARARIWLVASDGMRVVEDRSAGSFAVAGFCVDACEDGDACTVDSCVGGECLAAYQGGFDGVECELDKLLDPDICGVDPLPRKLERQIARKVAKARKALAKAEVQAPGPMRDKALGKAGRQLLKIVRKAERSAAREQVSAFCGHAVKHRALSRQRLVEELGS